MVKKYFRRFILVACIFMNLHNFSMPFPVSAAETEQETAEIGTQTEVIQAEIVIDPETENETEQVTAYGFTSEISSDQEADNTDQIEGNLDIRSETEATSEKMDKTENETDPEENNYGESEQFTDEADFTDGSEEALNALTDVREQMEETEELVNIREQIKEAEDIAFRAKILPYKNVKALKKYVSETSFITIQEFHDGTSVWKLTHIFLKYPSEQIHAAMSYDDYGGAQEKPTDAAKRLGATILVNGSYFQYDTGRPYCDDVVIKNRTVMEVNGNGTTLGNLIALRSDGSLYTPEQGTDTETMLKNGVTDTFSTGDILLVKDGVAYSSDEQIAQRYAGEAIGGIYPRTGIGMVDVGEYYIITAGDGGYENGITYGFMRDLFLSLGCSYARSLDGGGSAALVYKGKLINAPATGSERPVSDFLYFTD